MKKTKTQSFCEQRELMSKETREEKMRQRIVMERREWGYQEVGVESVKYSSSFLRLV